MNTIYSINSLLDDAIPVDFAPRRRRGVLVSSVLLVVLAAAWQALTLGFTGGLSYWTSNATTVGQFAVSFACLCLALTHALRLRGQLDFKFTQALLGASVVFGVYALVILIARLPFSRPLLISTSSEAALLSLAIVLVHHRLSPARVAIITPLTEGMSLAVPATPITDPNTDLRRFDVLLVSLTGPVSSEWSRALARAMLCGCRVRHVGEYVEELRGAVSLEHFEHDHLTHHSIASYRPLKRLVDILLALIAIPAVFPVLFTSMIAVALCSGFPVFFTQERAGLGGRAFRIWKLRTMSNAACKHEVSAALPGDQRVTGVGRFLRRFRIDELPQLWNVLRGDMSLIGPRPEALALHDEYIGKLPNYAYRYLVRPGITGWAQVNTTPSATAEEARRKLTFDLFYVKKVSLFLDFQILVRTLWTITSGAGVR